MDQLETDINPDTNTDSISKVSELNSPHKRSSSVFNYIINHRNEVIEKTINDTEIIPSKQTIELVEKPSELKNLLEINNLSKETSTEDIEIELTINKILENKKRRYYRSIRWFSVYMLYGIVGGLLINAITNVKLLNFDMMFNILISPIIYYHSPRKILTKISIKQFGIYYTIPFIFGLFFRFLDQLPFLSNFVLNPDKIKTTSQIILLMLLLIGILIITAYYILISAFPLVNTILISIHFLITFISMYVYYQSGGNIHIHHYFLALCIMLLSRNPHSNLVNIIHSFAYGVYIEGLSKWGLASLFWN